MQALYRVGEELLHRRLGKPKRKAPARVLWAKRAGVFALWTLSMVFFRMGSGTGTVGDCFGYLGGLARRAAPARFASELYSVAYNGFYANGLWSGHTMRSRRWRWRWASGWTRAGASVSATPRPNRRSPRCPAGGGWRCTWGWWRLS